MLGLHASAVSYKNSGNRGSRKMGFATIWAKHLYWASQNESSVHPMVMPMWVQPGLISSVALHWLSSPWDHLKRQGLKYSTKVSILLHSYRRFMHVLALSCPAGRTSWTLVLSWPQDEHRLGPSDICIFRLVVGSRVRPLEKEQYWCKVRTTQPLPTPA